MRKRPFCLALLGALACSRPPSESTPASTATAPSPTTPAEPAASPRAPPLPSAGGPSEALHWDDPPRWKRRPPSTHMRSAEYVIPRAAGDTQDGECTVLTFGRDQGGAVEQNADRWAHQFSPMAGPPSRGVREIKGMKVTRIEVSGTYHPMQMPGTPEGPSTLDNARLIGDIVEAPSGLWFFKMTGPDATIKAASTELDALISSLRP
jgi:hypothetical protein